MAGAFLHVLICASTASTMLQPITSLFVSTRILLVLSYAHCKFHFMYVF